VTLLTDLTDEQLLRQTLAGDEDAFTVLYHRRQGPIFRFALHMSGSAQIAEEVTQDVFMFLLQRGQGWEPICSGSRETMCAGRWSGTIRR